MNKMFSVLVVLVSTVLAGYYVQAQTQDTNGLVGKKWAGKYITLRPYRAVHKTNLEVARVTGGQIEGVLLVDIDGKQTVTNFKSPLERSPTGLTTFKVKDDSGAEYQCDIQTDGRLIIHRPFPTGTDQRLTIVPYTLDPVR